MGQRPRDYLINYGHPLATGLVFGHFGRLPLSTHYHDDSLYYNHGLLTLMDPTTNWVLDPVRGWVTDMVAASNQYVELGKNAVALGIVRHATFSAWVNTPDLLIQRAIFGDYNNLQGMTIRVEADESLSFFVYPNNHRIGSVGSLPTDVWNHVAGVMDGANMYLYLNGVQIGTELLGEDIGSSAGTMRIGSRGDGGNCYQGQLSQASIYLRALSSAEITTLANPADPFLGGLIMAPRRRSFPAAVAPSSAVPIFMHYYRMMRNAVA